MSVDLSGLAVGTAWRVRTSYDSGVLFVRGPDGHKQFVVQYDQRDGWDNFKETGLGVGGIHRIEQILHELNLVADITASDLDGRVIETEDGGKVLFADGHARLESRDGYLFGTWGGESNPAWTNGKTLAEEVAAYAAELERRRNPPVVIQWQGECRDDDGTLLSAWCEVRGEKWRVSRVGDDNYMLYRGKEQRFGWRNIANIEDLIRDHYASKDRATST